MDAALVEVIWKGRNSKMLQSDCHTHQSTSLANGFWRKSMVTINQMSKTKWSKANISVVSNNFLSMFLCTECISLILTSPNLLRPSCTVCSLTFHESVWKFFFSCEKVHENHFSIFPWNFMAQLQALLSFLNFFFKT